MPVISTFYGIDIILRTKNEHNPPHFHAQCGEYKALFDFDGKLLEGEFPKNKKKLVVAWAEIHKEELMKDWKLAVSQKETFGIEPLK